MFLQRPRICVEQKRILICLGERSSIFKDAQRTLCCCGLLCEPVLQSLWLLLFEFFLFMRLRKSP